MTRMRVSRLLALVVLLGSTVTAGALVGVGSASAAPGDFIERWCTSNPAPCLESATRNGTPVTEASANWEIQMTGELVSDGNRYFQWLIADVGGPADHATTDDWCSHSTPGRSGRATRRGTPGCL